MKQIKVLAIENDEFMKIFLKDAFWLHGNSDFDFSMVDNIPDAEKVLGDESKWPDLLLLDVMTSGDKVRVKEANKTHHFQFLKDLKTDEKKKKIKVIVFSTYGDKELEEEALKIGAEKFLVKGECLPQELTKIAKEIATDGK